VGGVVHITAQHASDDDNDSADEEVLLDNSPPVVLLKGYTTRIKITNSSMPIMALVADNFILSRRNAKSEALFMRKRSASGGVLITTILGIITVPTQSVYKRLLLKF
jgi:hypothetical protein